MRKIVRVRCACAVLLCSLSGSSRLVLTMQPWVGWTIVQLGYASQEANVSQYLSAGYNIWSAESGQIKDVSGCFCAHARRALLPPGVSPCQRPQGLFLFRPQGYTRPYHLH